MSNTQLLKKKKIYVLVTKYDVEWLLLRLGLGLFAIFAACSFQNKLLLSRLLETVL